MKDLFAELNKESSDLQKIIINIIWHMRGSISREEAWCALSPKERDHLKKFIEERMKLVEKTNLPLI